MMVRRNSRILGLKDFWDCRILRFLRFYDTIVLIIKHSPYYSSHFSSCYPFLSILPSSGFIRLHTEVVFQRFTPTEGAGADCRTWSAVLFNSKSGGATTRLCRTRTMTTPRGATCTSHNHLLVHHQVHIIRAQVLNSVITVRSSCHL